jgi:tRNA/tmRNA/rRNA uracil-C5-methylase (TrmA/RlmC/RlmD family)
MVSLPAPWIKSNHLEKGSEVSIDSLNNDLLISAKGQDYKSETVVTLTGVTESLVRTIITNTYRSGYDRIRVNYSDKSQLIILEKVVKTRLIGFEVVSSDKDYCIVENITEPSEEQFDNILNKILYNVEELFTITADRFSSREPKDDYENIEERIQKYDNFCRRVISKQRYNNDKSEMLWTFLTMILHGQRELYHLNKYLPKDYKAPPEIKHLLDKSREVFTLIKKSYLERNVKYLAEIHVTEKELIYDKGYLLLQQKKGVDAVVVYHLLYSIREFYQANSPLAGVLI